MTSIIENLITIANILDNRGETKVASSIDNASKVFLTVKQAQYVGVQGYWIQNGRCWQNCYRQKRSSYPTKPAQTVWTECWEEYQTSVEGNSKSWNKYASSGDNLTFKTANFKDETSFFVNSVKTGMKNGTSIGLSIFSSIEERKNHKSHILVEAALDLVNAANEISDKYPKIASDLQNISTEFVKEAGWWDKAVGGTKQVARDIGQGIGGSAGGFAGGLVGGLGGGFRQGLMEGWKGKPSPVPSSINPNVPPVNTPQSAPGQSQPSTQQQVSTNGSNISGPNVGGSNISGPNVGGSNTGYYNTSQPINAANVPSMLDSAFANMTWDRPSAEAAVKWLRSKLSMNPPSAGNSPSPTTAPPTTATAPPATAPTPTVVAPATPAATSATPATSPAAQTHPTKVNPSSDPQSLTSRTKSKVSQAYESAWSQLDHNQKSYLLRGKTPQSGSTGLIWPASFPKGFIEFVHKNAGSLKGAKVYSLVGHFKSN